MSSLLLGKLLLMLVTALGGSPQLATVFGAPDWDRGNPNPTLACYHRPIDDARDLVVAHRTLPCRSRVLLVLPRTGRAVVARVGDRGPRRADIDLSVQVARRLRHNGRETVLVIPLDEGAGPGRASLR